MELTQHPKLCGATLPWAGVGSIRAPQGEWSPNRMTGASVIYTPSIAGNYGFVEPEPKLDFPAYAARSAWMPLAAMSM